MKMESILPVELPLEAVAALRQGHKLAAIRIVRGTHDPETTGLKDAKDLVEAYLAENPEIHRIVRETEAHSKAGIVRIIVIAAVTASLLAVFFHQ